MAWVAAVTTAVLAALPGTALARPIQWNPAPCATGSMGTGPLTTDRGHYFLTTHMELCAPADPGYYYVTAMYIPGAPPLATPANLQSYRAPDRTDEIILDIVLTSFGLCLARDSDHRVACVRIDLATDGTATSTAIPIGDPLVSEPVSFLTDDPSGGVHPTYCGTCVTIYYG